MKEVLVYVSPDKALKTEVHNVPIPTPGPDQVVIRNVVVGTNPKDWKYPVIRAIVSQDASLLQVLNSIQAAVRSRDTNPQVHSTDCIRPR
jgi:hypothetical protein